MAITDKYFQFPLCALAYGSSHQERLNAILDYAVIRAGWQLWAKLSAKQQREFSAKQRKTRPANFDSRHWAHCAAGYGAHVIGVVYPDLNGIIANYTSLQKHIAEFESRNGRDALVRIKSDWLFKTRDQLGLTYREFAVLCAIYSAIGTKKLARITQPRIRRCGLGYRTAQIMEAELSQRTDAVLPLTERQLRDTIARLHRNKFFARCTVARRLTYYSIRLDHDALRKNILERRTYAAFFHGHQASQDAALTAVLKRKRAENS